jgi:16S rRNA processing protein RimM
VEILEKYLEIGQIVNTYGIKGYVKVVPYTDNIRRFDDLKTVYIEYKNELLKMSVEEVKYNKNLVLIKFKEIPDINIAEKFKNCFLKIDRQDAVKLPENAYFIVDLIGIDVYTINNDFLGILEDIYNTGSNDIYVVKDHQGKQILLPAISSVIKKIDLQNRKITVDLIEGLI